MERLQHITCGKSHELGVPIVTDAATASPIGLPTDGPVEPGTYGIAPSPRSVAGYTVTVPEGWATQYGQCRIKHSDAPVEVSFAPFVPDTIQDSSRRPALPSPSGPAKEGDAAPVR